ncbi:MAG TPA: tRNA-modifying protein YgfZ [Acidocella sp.]|nr:tRNA-modifying protein YgfZ [Acidocella sp.]
MSAAALPTNTAALDYAAHRIALGLPDGPPDLEVEKTLLLEAGFDEMGGVSWDKGCYMGQELTARTKYRGLVKKRLLPVLFEGAAPPAGTPVMAAEAEVGVVHSGAGRLALVTLRLEALDKPLRAADLVLTPQVPDWLKLA